MENLKLKSELTESQKYLVKEEYEKKKLKPYVMWLLYLFFGGLGAHRFYLKDYGHALSMLIVTLFISWITFGVATIIWLIIELFLIQNRINEKNEQIEFNIIQKVELITKK